MSLTSPERLMYVQFTSCVQGVGEMFKSLQRRTSWNLDNTNSGWQRTPRALKNIETKRSSLQDNRQGVFCEGKSLQFTIQARKEL